MAEWTLHRGTYDAATNLALDEVMLDRAADGDRTVRVYGFERPSVILARNESPADVREWRDGVDYTRRDTGGSVIYCDDNALFYSVAAPADGAFPERLHRDHYGPRIARALADAGVPEDRLGVGEHFSVRIDGGTVSGNSQRLADGAVLYHGVLAVEPWDTDHLAELVRLRERDGERERDFIAGLPGVADHAPGSPDEVADRVERALVERLTGGAYGERPLDGALEAAEEIADEKYRSDGWVRDARGTEGLKEDQGFCFVDWTDEWDESVREPGFY